MFVAGNQPSVSIFHIECQTAELGTLSPVGTTSVAGLGHIALATIAHTKSTMHKHLQRCLRQRLMNFGDFFKRQFACKHHLRKARLREELHLLHRAIVHLRAGMKGNGRQVHASDGHVLHNQRIHTSLVELPYHLLRLSQFLIAQDGVHRHIDAGMKKVGIVGQCPYIIHRVSCRCTGTESGRTNVHRISTVVNSRDAALQILRRSKQFDKTLVKHIIPTPSLTFP